MGLVFGRMVPVLTMTASQMTRRGKACPPCTCSCLARFYAGTIVRALCDRCEIRKDALANPEEKRLGVRQTRRGYHFV